MLSPVAVVGFGGRLDVVVPDTNVAMRDEADVEVDVVIGLEERTAGSDVAVTTLMDDPLGLPDGVTEFGHPADSGSRYARYSSSVSSFSLANTFVNFLLIISVNSFMKSRGLHIPQMVFFQRKPVTRLGIYS